MPPVEHSVMTLDADWHELVCRRRTHRPLTSATRKVHVLKTLATASYGRPGHGLTETSSSPKLAESRRPSRIPLIEVPDPRRSNHPPDWQRCPDFVHDCADPAAALVVAVGI